MVIGPDRTELDASEVGREELHSVLALGQLGTIHVVAEVGGPSARELLRDFVDVSLRCVSGMAREAICHPVVEGPPALHGRGLLALPRVRRRGDRLARLFVLPAGREGLQVLDDAEEVRFRDAVPGPHRGPVQAETDDAHEVVVVRQRAASDSPELERPEREVPRRRPDPVRGWPLPIPLVAVACPAIEGIPALAFGEHRGGNLLPTELHRLPEALRAVPFARRRQGPRYGGDEDQEEGLP